MHNCKKGHLKSKRSQLNERIALENMRRMLITSLAFVVLFFVEWIIMYLSRSGGKPVIGYYVAMAVIPGINVAFAVASFCSMAKKERAKVWLVNTFWVCAMISAFVGIYVVETQIVTVLKMVLIAGAVALVPLLGKKEFAVSAVMQFGAAALLLVTKQLDLEHFVYVLCVQVLCGVISRQSYNTFTRKVEDATKLNSAKNQAETDPMTGMLNRRGLERRIAQIWPMCVRQKLGVAVLMFDIDNFKKYNDKFGHPAGDECIRQVAGALMKQTKRKTDYCARVGGEEFLVFLTGISPQDTIVWAQECKKSIEELMIPHADTNFLPFVTVSVGVCHTNADSGMEFWEMRNEADRGLYQAKEAGRACVFMKDQCYAKTAPEFSKKQYYMERGFRSIG